MIEALKNIKKDSHLELPHGALKLQKIYWKFLKNPFSVVLDEFLRENDIHLKNSRSKTY